MRRFLTPRSSRRVGLSQGATECLNKETFFWAERSHTSLQEMQSVFFSPDRTGLAQSAGAVEYTDCFSAEG